MDCPLWTSQIQSIPNIWLNVPTASVQSLWRDVKVFDNHAFVVSEAPAHGMQVVDLTEVTQITDGPVELTLWPNTWALAMPTTS